MLIALDLALAGVSNDFVFAVIFGLCPFWLISGDTLAGFKVVELENFVLGKQIKFTFTWVLAYISLFLFLIIWVLR